MKKIYNLSVLLLGCICSISAIEPVKINQLFYYLDSSTETAEVTCEKSIWSDMDGNIYENDIPYELVTCNIPSSVKYEGRTYSVTSIGNDAFDECKSLTSITIPNTIKSIGGHAFCNTNLTTVTIPEGVQVIKDHAFKRCESLESVFLPNSVTSIERAAFEVCYNLKSITIPNQITTIRDWTFGECPLLETVIISSSVTEIECDAFYGCTSLKSVTCLAAQPPTMGVVLDDDECTYLRKSIAQRFHYMCQQKALLHISKQINGKSLTQYCLRNKV